MSDHASVYRTGDGLYFDTSKQDDYGFLTRLDRAGLQAGRRVEVGHEKNITAFALWKFSPDGISRQMEWDSPWGVDFQAGISSARPCRQSTLETGSIFNAVAKTISLYISATKLHTQVAHNTRLTNIWMIGHFLTFDANTKMSKSSGDLICLQTLHSRSIDPVAYRYLCLTAHYHSKLQFSGGLLTKRRQP